MARQDLFFPACRLCTTYVPNFRSKAPQSDLTLTNQVNFAVVSLIFVLNCVVRCLAGNCMTITYDLTPYTGIRLWSRSERLAHRQARFWQGHGIRYPHRLNVPTRSFDDLVQVRWRK